MEISPLIIDFVMAIASGTVTDAILKRISRTKNLSERINSCLNNALDRWNMPSDMKRLFKQNPIKHYSDLKKYLNNPEGGIQPQLKDLFELWIEEMQNDSLCLNFINQQKQDIANCRLSNELTTFKHDLWGSFSEISKKQDKIQDDVSDVKRMLERLVLSTAPNEQISNAILALFRETISSLIEDLKIKSASNILEEIAQRFENYIQQNNNLKAELSFRRAQIQLFKNATKAYELFHNAYIIVPDNETYAYWEFRRLLLAKNIDNANIVAERHLNCRSWRFLIDILKSDNKLIAYDATPEDIKANYDFRQILIENLSDQLIDTSTFLFPDEELNLPSEVRFSTLDAWMYIMTFYRRKAGTTVVLSFQNPMNDLYRVALDVSEKFYKRLHQTEIYNCFPEIRCLHCYWSYLNSKNPDWITEFQIADKSRLGRQNHIYPLMEASMLALDGQFDKAFKNLFSKISELNGIILDFMIMVSIISEDTKYLCGALEKAIDSNIEIESQSSKRIANAITHKSAPEVKNKINRLRFKVDAEKILLLELCSFLEEKKVDLIALRNIVKDLPDELKAYAASILAENGDLDIAFDMLKPIVDEDVPDIKREIFISVISKMHEKFPDLYRILVKNRHAGNFCDDRVLNLEFQLDYQIADYKNALEVIELLYNHHPEEISYFVKYAFTLSHIAPNRLTEIKEIALTKQYPDNRSVQAIYRAFSENGYLDTAAEILYRAAIGSDDFELRTYYHNEVHCGMIRTLANKEYEIACEGNYVLCEKDGSRLFYKATVSGNSICKALLGCRKNDVIQAEIAFEQTQVNVIGIFNKYYKLAFDIIQEAQSGCNPGLIPFHIDQNAPVESLDEFIRKISGNGVSSSEQIELAYNQYEKGEIGLIQLVDNTNIIGSYYDLLFSPLKIHVNPTQPKLKYLEDDVHSSTFILDLPSIICLSEFSAKTGYDINGRMAITAKVNDYIQSAIKHSNIIARGEYTSSFRKGNIRQYDDHIENDLKIRFEHLAEWVKMKCKIIIADKALAFPNPQNDSPVTNLMMSSISLLLEPGYYFVTDDKKIDSLLAGKHVNSRIFF